MERLYDAETLKFSTLSELMRDAVKAHGDRPLWGIKKDGAYHWMTYSEFGTLVRKFRTCLKSCGLQKGDRIAVIANNSIEFAMTAYAAYGLGCVLVPMYEVQKLQDWEWIFNDSKPRIAVVGNDSIREKLEGLELKFLEKFFIIRPQKERSLMEITEAEEVQTELDPAITGDDVSDIVYTSGTTGMPRGVVLTHRAVVENVKATVARFPLSCNDRTMAFLPWAHAFGKTVELHIFPSIGAAIGLVESNRTIAQNLLEVNPTILVSVPKIFNTIYDTIHLKMEEKPAARILFEHTKTIVQRGKEGKLSLFGRAQQKVLDKVVASKIRAAFGNSLRFSISGGASLSQEVASFFQNFGVRVYEGYGMTEHSPIVCVNNPEVQQIGSVGRPLPGVKIEILHDNDALDKSDERCGEIVVSSASIMKEYYNAPETTQEVIDSEGRLHTGDMGYLDEFGCLWITGRVKEQYKLENGKYVVPTALEEKINNSTMFNLSVVFGAGKPYNVVLLNPTKAFVDKFRADHHLENVSDRQLADNKELREKVSKELQAMCAEFRGYERPQKFAVVLDEFTIDNGLLTPALKIKRREVEKRFSDILEKLYKP